MSSRIPLREVTALEHLSSRAWPALHTSTINGWTCRASKGYSKRANSISPSSPPAGDFHALQPAFEEWAKGHGIPCIIRITPLAPPGTDEACERAGYERVDPALVMLLPELPGLPGLQATTHGGQGDTRSLESLEVEMQTEAPEPGALGMLVKSAKSATLATPVRYDVRHTSKADQSWLKGYAACAGHTTDQTAAHAEILSGIRPEATFVSIIGLAAGDTSDEKAQTVGLGYAVLDEGMIGLFDVLVDESHRGRGLGKRVVRALLGRGREQGATGAYLQVGEGNVGARRMYEGLGFQVVYGYHYRQKK